MTGLIIAATIAFPLEWAPATSSASSCEVELDPKKLGVHHFVVRADQRPLQAETFEGKAPGSVRLRFRVPEGTKDLDCIGDDGPSELLKSASGNLFASALESTRGWCLKNAVAQYAEDGGIVLLSEDEGVASYTVPVPKDIVGSEVQFEVEVENVGKMCSPNNIVVWQLDASGEVLAEPLVDPRWASHIRPVGRRTHIREKGHLHPQAAKLRIEFSLSASRSKYDLYGYPITDETQRRAKLKVTRIAVRQGRLLPFPKYRDDFFAEGVSGNPGDCAIRMGGDRRQTAIWYQTRSMDSWANIRSYAGDDAQLRDENLVFFPSAAGTVEVWLKPEWKRSDKREIVIFEGTQASLCQYKGVYRPEKGRVFAVTYTPSSGIVKMMRKDSRGVLFEGEGRIEIPAGVWVHIASVFEPGGEGALYVDGKRTLVFPMSGYVPVDLKSGLRPNDDDVTELYLGADSRSTRRSENPFAVGKSPYYEGLADCWRVSTGVRYREDFAPARTHSVDADTRAYFSFDRSYSGVSGGGIGWIPLTVQAFDDRVEHVLETDHGPIQYWAKDIQPEADPRVQLDWVNYRDLPTVEDFVSARRVKKRSAKLKVGEAMKVEVTNGVFSDFVEIENKGADVLRHPMLLNGGEIDPRSFGDFRDSLLVRSYTDWQTANAIFQYAIRKSDYFNMHTACFPYDGGDEPKDVWFEGLGMLNSYCGFECGPLNTVVKNLFACAGGLPSSMTQGYGHSFEQVFFDGKNHVYDLSAQKFFPAMDNETAAYLEEMADQPGLKRRHFGSVDHFIRNSTRPAGAGHPVYQRKIAMSLKPGERFRVWFDNNGEVNDLMCSPQIDRRASKEKPGVISDYSARVHAVKSKVWRINRFFPQYASGFLRWDGTPATAARGVFRDNGSSFDYEVETCYPVVSAEYSAECDGRKAQIEISTDRGSTFRPLGEGLRRYEVRARYRYTVRVKAPIGKVSRFAAMTEVQLNSRVFPGRLHAGTNELTLKGTGTGLAEVTVGWRENAKRLEVCGALCSGVIPGSETSLLVVDPTCGPAEFEIIGGSGSMGVEATEGIDARLANGKLVLSVAGSPRIGYVKLIDGDLEKALTVLASDGVRLVRPSDFQTLNGATLARAGKELVQDAIVYHGRKDAAEARFAPIAVGKYSVLVLERFPALQEGAIRSPRFRISVGGVRNEVFGLPANYSCDYFKAMYGRQGGRANWKWDYLVDKDVPYALTPIGVFDLGGAEKLNVSHIGRASTPPGDMEVAAVLLVPDDGSDFRFELVKVLCGVNTQAWKVR